MLQYETTLVNHGGEVTRIRADADGDLDLSAFTHIVAANTDFHCYRDARDLMIPVIMPSWITQSLLRNRPAMLRPHNPDPKLIFSNVTLTCGDLPVGDKDAIIGAVLAMGGMESNTLTRTTTHVCSLTADHPKAKDALSKPHSQIKVVLPHWSVTSPILVQS